MFYHILIIVFVCCVNIGCIFESLLIPWVRKNNATFFLFQLISFLLESPRYSDLPRIVSDKCPHGHWFVEML
jgi:hypothetical protein